MGYAIAVDTNGCAYVTGLTNSSDFPATHGTFQATYGGDCDAFVTKLNACGTSLVYSTFLGGSYQDYGDAIAVDTNGCAYVHGGTEQPFPTTPGAYNTAGGDAFVTKLNSTGSGLIYSTYFGGSGYSFGLGVAVDAGGCAYVTGGCQGFRDVPTTPGAFCATFDGGDDSFVSKLNMSPVYGGTGGGTGELPRKEVAIPCHRPSIALWSCWCAV